MDYRVEELARAAAVGVDTVRFYQSRGLLPSPERRGRVAIYSDDHLTRLRRIRELKGEGVTLEGIRRLLLERDGRVPVKESLLAALSEAEGERFYTRAELSARTGVPELLIGTIERAELLQPLLHEGEPRYTEADCRSVEAARLLLEAGFPVQDLLPLARRHAEHINEFSEAAIELFERHVRRAGGDASPSSERVTEIFRELLPAATTLVALHFQRTLIQRARVRLARAGDDEGLEAALAATERARLNVSWV
jgi:DNA-binding transcriptional MerR regulator